jgi:hypothetical protein
MRIILFLSSDIHAATALKMILPTLVSDEIKIVFSQKTNDDSILAEEIKTLQNLEKCDFKTFFPNTHFTSSSFFCP